MSRKNISLSEQIEQRAQAVIESRGFSGLSDLIAVLVREEYERRFGPMMLTEQPVTYKIKTKKGKP